jgi:cytochrome c-type biogenesis protein CcmH/NrfG
LDDYLEVNPEDAEKWIELADLCKNINFLEKARTSYNTAAELSQSQGKDELYKQIMAKLDKL